MSFPIQLMLAFSIRMIGVPYQWGGNDCKGYDCSGFVLDCLRVAGIDLPDKTSQQLYETFLEKSYESKLLPGSILFFGKDDKHINHVAIAINERVMISASGGDHTTTTLSEAIRRNAFVKVQSNKKRND